MNRSQFGFAVTFLITTFAMICYYFDQHRHRDPYFRKRLKSKRQKDRLIKSKLRNLSSTFENCEDKEFAIFKEIGIAEEMMITNNYDKAVIHFAKAITFCVNPYNLLSALQRTLPTNVYDLLIYVLITNYGEELGKFKDDDRIKKLLENRSTGSYFISAPTRLE